MSEHQKDTEFLRRIIVYDDTEEHRDLEKKIAGVQREERCLQRVALAAALFTLVAIVGLGYTAILEENFPYNQSQMVVTVLCDFGLASLICLVGFAVLLLVYRNRLNRLREECRHSVVRLIEVRMGKSQVVVLHDNHFGAGDRETTQNSTKVIGSPENLGLLRQGAMDDESNHSNHLSAA